MIKNKWRKLDNTAKIFSLDSQKDNNTFRFSICLKQNIDESTLKKALERSLYYYPVFKVKLSAGIFWNYLEFNSKEPIIIKEDGNVCRPIHLKENNDYLFKVTYYKNKINLDFFHVLTDGAGAIEFLKSIIYSYLDLKNELPFHMNTVNDDISYHDQYLKNYDKSLKTDIRFKKAYQLSGKTHEDTNNTYHYIIDITEIKKDM